MLVFVDSPRQALFAAGCPEYRAASTRLVALTADACQALDEVGLPYEPILALADLAALRTAETAYIQSCFDLARRIEAFVGKRNPVACFDGPGFLSAQLYHLQHSFGAILARASLMRTAIDACSAKHVHLFAEDVESWFAASGYAHNPWLDMVEDYVRSTGAIITIRQLPIAGATALWSGTKIFFAGGGFSAWARSRVKRLTLVQRWLETRRLSSSSNIPSSHDLSGLRLLFCGSVGYDWIPVLSTIVKGHNMECAVVRTIAGDEVGFRNYYASSVERLPARKSVDLGIPCPEFDDREKNADLFDKFVREEGMGELTAFFGPNVERVLAPLLRLLTGIGPGLVRHADAIAERALQQIKPEVVCFTNISGVADRRFAFRCREHGIPVVCYQHGGTYGTHELPSHGAIETSDADYFLTYGVGIVPQEAPVLPNRAWHVPVGSSRIEEMRTAAAGTRKASPFTVLWVAGLSYRNTIAATYIVEDTTRFLLQKECLTLLATGQNMRIVFRPFPFAREWQATPRWLRQTGLSGVVVDTSTRMQSLIMDADVVVIDSASSTVWNEVIALGKPLVVYCDPSQTAVRPHFAEDLERACHWTKSRQELFESMKSLVHDPHAFISEIGSTGRADFLKRYVLHEGDCVARVISFLSDVRSAGSNRKQVGSVSQTEQQRFIERAR